MTESAPPRWLTGMLTALVIAYAASLAVVLWTFFQLPLVGDEPQYLRWFTRLRTEGVVASMAAGDPVGYLLLVRLAGGDWSFLLAGRLLGVAANILLVWSLWRLCVRLGVSSLGRRFALLGALNLVLSSHSWAFKAIADTCFTVIVLWTIVWIERAVRERRVGLAIGAGAAWAVSFTFRPLALLYGPAFVLGLLVLVLRDGERRRALAYASIIAMVCGVGVLSAQAPALRAHGRPAFEKKISPRGIWAQRRFLSLLRYEEHGAWRHTVRIPLVDWDDVQRYNAEHGPDALPATNVETWRRHPWRRLREYVINVVLRTNVYVGVALGLWYPLAWVTLLRRQTDPWRASLFTFAGVVLVAYTLGVNVLVSPFFETRWVLAPLVAAIGAGVLALDRLWLANRPRALQLAALQVGFLWLSCVFWLVRAAIRTDY